MRKLPTLALVLLASPALAANWVVDPTKSTLTFTGKQSDDSFAGKFTRFTPEIDFSEAAPENAHIHILIDMTSATVDGKDRNDALPTDDWFGVKTFPKAEFTSTKVAKTGEHQFAATGNLSLHGVTKEITLPFTLTPEGPQTRATGSVVLSRNDYKIGSGRWVSDQWIAYPVTVTYTILATPAK